MTQTEKPKFRVGETVKDLNGRILKIDAIEWSYAYHLENDDDFFLFQEDEIRKVKKMPRR